MSLASPPRRALAAELLPDWIAADCELDRNNLERAGVLYGAWCGYARARGAEPGSPAEFAHEMERRGFSCDRLQRGDRTRIRWGIRLRTPPT
jgi:hypothetical protein